MYGYGKKKKTGITCTLKGDEVIYEGETYGIRDKLKTFSCRWSPENKVWWVPLQTYKVKLETAERVVSQSLFPQCIKTD
jgi:hypothetical protein